MVQRMCQSTRPLEIVDYSVLTQDNRAYIGSLVKHHWRVFETNGGVGLLAQLRQALFLNEYIANPPSN